MLPDQIDKRIKLLEEFLNLLRDFWGVSGQLSNSNRDEGARFKIETKLGELRSAINRKSAAAAAAAEQSGVGTSIVMRVPPTAGGGVATVELFENVFGNLYMEPVLPHTLACVERAIGAYEAVRIDPTLSPSDASASLDLVNAVRRALRPSFRHGPPQNERQVQDAVEVILQALGSNYVRDKEVAAVGATFFKPDFTIPTEELAIEVKLANEKHSAADVQHELAEDVAGYKTKWKRLIAIIYDCGAIHDPEQMIEANQQHFGVTVLIVKH